ncbi:hypothetical protein CA982_19470 [Gordonia lacunae]|uniref:Uncharacterized protein n=1 Tax=Gordonia lacunae TaxID=417102 RepID=A0A243Q6I6_9ACTN|nr:hypothetical protein CA982_19470 [Gordonia lacunae]
MFYRDTFVVWRGNWWFVPKILPDRFTLDCKLHSGNTSVTELRKDPHTWEGDDQFDFWARLTLDDIDTLVINETEIHNGRKDESTTRRIYTWNKPATKGPETT